MRFLLSLLAVLAMLANPAIAGAKAGCNEVSPRASSSMKMSGMASMNVAILKHAAAPCCDPGADTTFGKKPMSSKDCAQACAAMATVAVMTTPQDRGALLTYTLALLTPPASDTLRANEPSRLDRPPKQIA